MLSVGERRAYTANDIFRDPSWRKRDTDGALRVSVEDAQALGLVDGCRARITTAAGSAEATVEITETMLPGHAALPNGFGLDYIDDDGHTVVPGVAPNALTSTEWRDAYAGTPWHKHVPARIEALAACRRQFQILTRRCGVQEQRVVLGDLEGVVEGVHVADARRCTGTPAASADRSPTAGSPLRHGIWCATPAPSRRTPAARR